MPRVQVGKKEGSAREQRLADCPKFLQNIILMNPIIKILMIIIRGTKSGKISQEFPKLSRSTYQGQCGIERKVGSESENKKR